MALSSDLISQFAKITKDETSSKKDATVYGSIHKMNNQLYVKIDGSDLLTPVSTTTDVKDGDRVSVTIKNHTVMINGKISSPAYRTSEQEKTDVGTISDELIAKINSLQHYISTGVLTDEDIEAINIDAESIKAKVIDTEELTAADIRAINASIERIEGKIATFKDVSIDDLEAINANIGQLKAYNANFTYMFANELSAINGKFQNLDAQYVNVDFAKIDEAWLEEFYANSGLIKDAVIDDGTIIGHLTGVTITGDLIEANTIIAKSIMIDGGDGLYYRLNSATGKQVYKTTEDIYVAFVDAYTYYKVESTGVDEVIYTLTDETAPVQEGSELINAITETGEQVYTGVDSQGEAILFANVTNHICYKVEYDSDSKSYSMTDEVISNISEEECEKVPDEYVKPEQSVYNSLHGSNILAKSIAATKIDVSDLVAFDATIGGLVIEDGSIHTFTKDSIDNTAAGILFCKDGQFNLGNSTSYLKFKKTDFKKVVPQTVEYYNYTKIIYVTTDEVIDDPKGSRVDETYTTDGDDVYTATVDGETIYYTGGVYKLAISADSIVFGKNHSGPLADVKALTERVKIGTWVNPDTKEVNPGIVLDEGDTTCKNIITNKASRFLENDTVKTEVGVDGITAENVTVTGESRQNGWAWITHGPGNLGLTWKGDAK